MADGQSKISTSKFEPTMFILYYMSDMKILHTADVHLKSDKDERWETLLRLIKLANKEHVDVFVISGDLFDGEKEAEMLRTKIREVFSNNNFPILLISGNHDKDVYKKGLYFGDDVVVLSSLDKPFEKDGVLFWGLPFDDLKGDEVFSTLYSLRDKLPHDKKNILLYHGELIDISFKRSDFGEEGERRYMPVKLSYFNDLNFNYILAGHFHSRFYSILSESGTYFVYPGSPVSITKKEIGQRSVNLFKLPEKPHEYAIDTPHYEEVILDVEPFSDKNPLDILEERMKNLHPEAHVILKIRGYFNGVKLHMSEADLIEKIKTITKDRVIETHFQLKDIGTILEDDLFKGFMKKLNERYDDEELKYELTKLVIRAMAKAKTEGI